MARFINMALLSNSIPWLEKTVHSCNCCLLVLKFVVVNLCECTKIDVNQVRQRYLNTTDNLKTKKNDSEPENKLLFKYKIFENWSSFETEHAGGFWNMLQASQYSAISYGIRLLSYLAKRDPDFLIRETSIQETFHLFLQNIDSRIDIKLKNSDRKKNL